MMTQLRAQTMLRKLGSSAKVLVAFQLVAVAIATAQDLDFNRDIRPILSDKCFHCHGPDSEHREAELRLDRQDSATEDRGGYRVVDAEHAEKSTLWQRIISTDDDERMPPPDSGKSLTKAEIKTIQSWLRQGAPWAEQWAYVAPEKHRVPKTTDADWSRNWIDSFILAQLEEKKLRPAADADRVTLVRRLYFDLIGLPPSPAQMAAALADTSEKGYEAIVDSLLASDHFGERMAMYWLDLVRYADTVGYHGDQDHNISPYRDYVIDAFNENLPFDQFTRDQLAGDLLPNSTIDQKVASGYNRLLQTSHEGGVQKQEYLAIYAADRIRNVSTVWMGATMGCCQCHDHKYDPYTMKDFYSMVAFFADLDESQHFSRGTNSLPTARPPELDVLSKRQRREIQRLESSQKNASEEERAKVEARIQAIRKATRRTMVSVSIEPRPIRVLPRGNWLDESGPIVSPSVPEFLGGLELDRRASRLDLANWLTDESSGYGRFTARVFANRIWYLLFGEGLSRSLDDFGNQGTAPTHPQLLDNLAIELIDSEWNVKQLIKRIVMSRAYRQSSVAAEKVVQMDLENHWLARQNRFRLPAEMIRDNALSISGLLVPEIGGASVKPYQPAGYYRHLNFPTRRYSQHSDNRQWRRGLYIHWQRQFLHPMLKAFDAPSREECTARRPQSNTPTAALTLLNDPTFVEAARAFAVRTIQKAKDDRDRWNYAFELAVSRKPNDAELKMLLDYTQSCRKYFDAEPERAEELIGVGLSDPGDDIDTRELAVWTSGMRALLNINETHTRN